MDARPGLLLEAGRCKQKAELEYRPMDGCQKGKKAMFRDKEAENSSCVFCISRHSCPKQESIDEVITGKRQIFHFNFRKWLVSRTQSNTISL
ncbi:hypothetical protein HMF8227_00770 [Saliniradius amylolyticus]|uniref:Uncharacterized protein n=1 Tax=Saliniradius amylolyticus TaxID=2183582 RepID=A0A2S2E0W5_9ALTE|nr:hypothetical protein HMF8227_00770 [Saliniradius amylolyticus]